MARGNVIETIQHDLQWDRYYRRCHRYCYRQHRRLVKFETDTASRVGARTMIFTKASMQVKAIRKLLDRHETSNGRSIQRAEHRAAHEICRKR